MSLADASDALGVSSERVRQLVVAGDLPGVRFGNAWAVPREAIVARRHASNRRGRPLSARRAWESIEDGDLDLANVSRYRNRGEAHRYGMSAADLAFIKHSDRAIVSGVVAAIDFGELLQPEPSGADLYVPVSFDHELGSLIAAVPDQLGSVVLRLVPDEIWPYVESLAVVLDGAGHRLAPPAAVALDLMDSGDPRHWVAAEYLIESHD